MAAWVEVSNDALEGLPRRRAEAALRGAEGLGRDPRSQRRYLDRSRCHRRPRRSDRGCHERRWGAPHRGVSRSSRGDERARPLVRIAYDSGVAGASPQGPGPVSAPAPLPPPPQAPPRRATMTEPRAAPERPRWKSCPGSSRRFCSLGGATACGRARSGHQHGRALGAARPRAARGRLRGSRTAASGGGRALSARDGARLRPYVASLLGDAVTQRLSRAALETLTIVAYKQPCTRAEIEAIRGVSSDRLVASLEQRGLLENVGTAHSPGRPKLYRPARQFYEHFGLRGQSDLPALPEETSAKGPSSCEEAPRPPGDDRRAAPDPSPASSPTRARRNGCL